MYAEAPELGAFGTFPASPLREFLFCFDLEQGQSQRIDPQADSFLGRLVFSGRNNRNGDRAYKVSLQLPAGLYLFAQKRRAVGREECIALAIEQQKDGLWERLKLGDRLFIRCLYEDGSPVTQLFRPGFN
jgi:hypothetical protein